MNYFLTDDQKMIKDLAAQIAREKIAPIAAELDESGEFPWEVVKTLAQSDLFRVFIPTEYDGLGGGMFEMCLVVEELSRACSGIALAYAASGLGTIPIILFGNEEQKKKYLPRLAAGEILAAFGLTESGAGSDAAAIKTTAKPDGDCYVMNGTKQWITNGGEASIYTVVALTDPVRGVRGSSTILVDKGQPGFTFGKKENKMGIRASATRELVFQDCRVPKSNLLAKEGMGFLVAMKTLDQSRPGVASQALGIAQGAMDKAIEYSRERKQFGKPISAFQGIQFMLADMSTEIEAARWLCYLPVSLLDAGKSPRDVSTEIARSKLYAVDMGIRTCTKAVQILGGYGLSPEYHVERRLRDVLELLPAAGTQEIMRVSIGSAITR